MNFASPIGTNSSKSGLHFRVNIDLNLNLFVLFILDIDKAIVQLKNGVIKIIVQRKNLLKSIDPQSIISYVFLFIMTLLLQIVCDM
jgi:hypothetical protein